MLWRWMILLDSRRGPTRPATVDRERAPARLRRRGRGSVAIEHVPSRHTTTATGERGDHAFFCQQPIAYC